MSRVQTLSPRGTWDTPGGGSPQDRTPGGRQVGLGWDPSCPCVGGGACSVGPRRGPAPAPTPQSRTSTWPARVLGTLPRCSGCPAGLCAAARLPGEAPPASSAVPPGAWGWLRRALHLRPWTRHASAGAAGRPPLYARGQACGHGASASRQPGSWSEDCAGHVRVAVPVPSAAGPRVCPLQARVVVKVMALEPEGVVTSLASCQL